MAPRKGIKRGTLKEQTKEILVIVFFLKTGNNWATADRIRDAWTPGKPRSIGSLDVPVEVSPRGRTLSRAGAVKVCERLIAEEVVQKRVRKGYRNKIVKEYQLIEDKIDSFLNVARKVHLSLLLLLESEYGRRGIRDRIMPAIEETLRIDLDSWKDEVEWVLERSPTAFTIATSKGLPQGEIAMLQNEQARLREFLATLVASMKVDRASRDRGWLIIEDQKAKHVEDKLINVSKGEGLADGGMGHQKTNHEQFASGP